MTVRERDIDDPDLTLEEMLRYWPATGVVFIKFKMHCVGCPIAAFHTLADAIKEYDLDSGAFRTLLRKVAAEAVLIVNRHPRSIPSDEEPSP